MTDNFFFFQANNFEKEILQENKLHFSNGFVQVPIGETKELYGIKFEKQQDGEIFYGKVIREMG